LSDYRYGVLTPRVLRAVADLQARWARVLVADSRRLLVFRELGVTAVKPNFEEAVALLGGSPLEGMQARAEAVLPHGNKILELTGAQVAAVTLDADGAVIFERGRAPYRTHAQAARQSCVAGAGDTFTVALALALAARAPTAA